jgi:hypothetical protein
VKNGQTWTFDVCNPNLGEASLTFPGIETITAEDEVVLVNLQNSVPVYLRNIETYKFQTVTERTSFRLIVGGESYVKEEISKLVPAEFRLEQNYPNPFNPSTVISFSVPRVAQVRLTVYSVLGQSVSVLVDNMCQPGIYTLRWDATNSARRRVASGVYFYRLFIDGHPFGTKKMILLR